MYKIDLHTHSTASDDGGITPDQYQRLIKEEALNYIAITDHNTIKQAIKLHKMLGNAIIVGEEIDSTQGEIIGLYLKDPIPKGMSALETAKAIKSQGGLVYIPHPFETVRHGISKTALIKIINMVDIIEVFNGRALFQNKGPEAVTVAKINNLPGASSSDAHGIKGISTAYSIVAKQPTATNLPQLLQKARFSVKRPPLRALFYPKVNRIRKRWSNG